MMWYNIHGHSIGLYGSGVDPGDIMFDTGVVNEVAGEHVVCAIEDDITCFEELFAVSRVQVVVDGFDIDV